MPEDEAARRAREVIAKARDPKEALKEAQRRSENVNKIFRDSKKK